MKKRNYKKKIRRQRYMLIFSILLCLLLVWVVAMFMFALMRSSSGNSSSEAQTEPTLESVLDTIFSGNASSETEAAPPFAMTAAEKAEKEKAAEAADALHDAEDGDAGELEERDIYTFMQGPRAWRAKAPWSGAWCEMILGDQEFSIFGCGLCCMANMYSTLTPFNCSPVDMFEYAKEVTDYSPSAGYGAIDWSYMRKAMKKTGIVSKLKRKDKTYEKFQESIAGGITAVVLICSENDATYWENSSGHYVNIWLYDSEDDTVFLADSGNLEHNRRRIPLRYVYDALKTSSKYQYMLVTSVDEEGNTWQHDGIKERWRKPSYIS